MHVEQRTLHPEQRSTHPQLLENQQRLLWEQWGNDIEIYDDAGELIAITSKSNPNLGEILEQYGITGTRWNHPH